MTGHAELKRISGAVDAEKIKCSLHNISRVTSRLDTGKNTLCKPLHDQSRNYISLLTFFSTSPKRGKIFGDSFLPDEKVLKLKDWAPTRMQHLYEANSRIREVFMPIIRALEIVTQDSLLRYYLTSQLHYLLLTTNLLLPYFFPKN